MASYTLTDFFASFGFCTLVVSLTWIVLTFIDCLWMLIVTRRKKP